MVVRLKPGLDCDATFSEYISESSALFIVCSVSVIGQAYITRLDIDCAN